MGSFIFFFFYTFQYFVLLKLLFLDKRIVETVDKILSICFVSDCSLLVDNVKWQYNINFRTL